MTSSTLLAMLEQRGLLPDVPFYGANLLPVPEPSRVAYAGCWHARHDLIADAMHAAKTAGADTLVHTGDFLYTGTSAAKALMVIEETAQELDMFVVAVRGNHDEPSLYRRAVTATRRRSATMTRRGQAPPQDPFARLSERVLHAPNGTRWTWGGVEFVALGGAFSVDRAARTLDVSYWAGEVASPRDVGKVKSGGPAQVMITHDIPDGADLQLPPNPPDWWDLDNAQAHRRLLRSAVDVVRPDWVIGGHMHVRRTASIWLPEGHQVRVEVLDRVESGVANNLLVADLIDGQVLPVS